MPVTGATTRNDHTSASGQTVFAYTFEILDQADIKVFKNNTLLTLTTDYTVSGVGSDSGGNVTLTSGATVNDVVSIVLAMSITRTTNYQNAGDFLASDVNGDFDKAYISLNQLQTGLNRSIHLADSDPTVTMELPLQADRANNFLKFNSVGQVTTSNLDDLTVESLTVEKSDNAGEAVLRVHNSATTGDSDAVVRIDSSSNGESVVEFYHDGTKGARVEWFTDGNPDLNIATESGQNGNIDLQPNDVRTLRVSEGLTDLRRATDGVVATFTKDSDTCGQVYAVGGSYPSITIGSTGVGLRFVNNPSQQAVAPYNASTGAAVDDSVDLGLSSARFDDIYATNGTIQTSDQNEKQDIAQLSDAEQRVAVACKGLVRKFKWRSSVEENASEARYHFGVIAQDVQAAFAAEGLDAGDYGLFISGTWTDDEGVEQTRLGVRYTELLAFIISAL